MASNTRLAERNQPPATAPTPQPPPALPTPIHVAELQHLLRGYADGAKDRLLTGFTEGFQIHFHGELPTASPPNHPSALANATVVDDILREELSLGRIAGPFENKPFHDFCISPLGVVPKKEPSKFRLIHDLSFPKGNSVNDGIPKEFCTVQYEDFDYVTSLMQSLGQGCWIAKADIESAFRILPISPGDYHLLGFKWKGLYYYHKTLVMGCSMSCQTFEHFSQALQWILQVKYSVATMSHILDDFIFLSNSQSECSTYLSNFMHLAALLHIPVKSSKTVHPATTVTLHGIEVDTVLWEARLPADKVQSALEAVEGLRRRKKVTLRELQSLIGLLSFCCKVVLPGRAFLRRLIDLTCGVTKPGHHIRISAEARKDLTAWSGFLQTCNGRVLFLSRSWTSSEHIKLYTDASGLGFAAILGDQWFQGGWPVTWRDVNIAAKELLPIVIAVRLWSGSLCNKKLLMLCDNIAVVYVINTQTSKDKRLMSLLRSLIVTCMQSNIMIRAKHIPGLVNVAADALSRFHNQVAFISMPSLRSTPTAIPDSLLPWPT